MNTLFPPVVAAADVPTVPGLRYLPDYVTDADERELAVAVDGQPWNTEWRRRRQSYGAGYGGSDAPAPPIPAWGRRLADRMFADGITPAPFDHMLINEYLPGQGISLHTDYAPCRPHGRIPEPAVGVRHGLPPSADRPSGAAAP